MTAHIFIKIILAACMQMVISVSLMGQNSKKEASRIQADDHYLWGIGEGDTHEKASNSALANLMSKISAGVSQSTSIAESEVTKDGQLSQESAIRSVIETYSSGRLAGTKEIILSEKPPYKVIRYINKDEVARMFEDRTEKARQYVRDAMNEEQAGRIGYALHDYYSALCLLKSVQYPTRVTLDDHGTSRRLDMWIPQKMKDLFDGIKAEAANVDLKNKHIDLLIKHQGKEVTNLTVSYYDGAGWSVPHEVKGGKVQLQMRPQAMMDKVSLKYLYKDVHTADEDVRSTMKVFSKELFTNSTVSIDLSNKATIKTAKKAFQQSVEKEAVATGAIVEKATGDKDKVIRRIIKAIQDQKYDDITSLFTPSGYDMLTKLLKYGHATILGQPKLSFYKMQDKTVCRSITMQFDFDDNPRKFVEDVTFTFNQNGKIESLAFALDQAAKKGIFEKAPGLWNDSIRMVLASFLENYKTAYALKRLDYIESIFKNDALIIVGHVLKPAAQRMENEKYLNNPKYIKYTQLSKQQYLKNLEKCFSQNSVINIQFEDSDVERLQDGVRYGIQVKQRYFSSHYSDEGYLFLMVDFREPNTPEILVRAWQAERDPNINGKLDKANRYYGLINAKNF